MVKDNRKGEVTKCIADISKAKAVLDYSPEVNIDFGIEKTVNWYSSRIDEYLTYLEEVKN